jgi:phospholipid-binding lipoprotein MlaA
VKPHATLGGILALGLSLACATSDEPAARARTVRTMGVEQHRQPTTGDTYEIVEYLADPLEPVNRGSFAFTRGAIDYAVRPAAIGWHAIFAKPIRRGIDNFAYNLDFPDRFASLLLQGRLARAGAETGNFLVNTTVGLAGFIDVSGKLGIPTYDEDVGQAFGKWGIGPGPYLFLPLLGPSSGRDAVGKVFDAALSPTTWVNTYGIAFGVFAVNAFSSRIGTYDRLKESGVDFYLPVRALWAIKRDIEVSDYDIPEAAWASADPAPSLGIMLTRLDDPAFARKDVRGEVEIGATGGNLPYSLWLQERPAPLLFVVPGIGSHRTATNAVKLAESAFARGYSVVAISNPFNPEFIAHGLSATYPGFTPSDAADLYRALGEIRADLERNHPGQVTSASLMGYSLGGIAALFVSQIERAAPPDGLHFERVVAINPAVDLQYAAGLFDLYFDASLGWPEAQRRGRTIETVKKAYVIAQGTDPAQFAKYRTLPFGLDESNFLIGLSSRATTIQAISASRLRGGADLPPVASPGAAFRGPFVHEVEVSTLKRYMEALAIPYFVEKSGGGQTVDQLFAQANLYGQEAALRGDPRIHVFTNADDFILRESDLSWLERLFAGRITVFPAGGHLGNMHQPQVQAAFMDALGPAPARPPIASAERTR